MLICPHILFIIGHTTRGAYRLAGHTNAPFYMYYKIKYSSLDRQLSLNIHFSSIYSGGTNPIVIFSEKETFSLVFELANPNSTCAGTRVVDEYNI